MSFPKNEYLNIARDEGVSELVADIGQHIANQRKRHGPDPEFDLMIMGSFIAIITKIAHAKGDRNMHDLMIAGLQEQKRNTLKALDQK